MSHKLLVSQQDSVLRRPYKPSHAPLIPPQESLALDLKEALGLPPSSPPPPPAFKAPAFSPAFSPAAKPPSTAALSPPAPRPSVSSLASQHSPPLPPPASKPSYSSLAPPALEPAAKASSPEPEPEPEPAPVPHRPQTADGEPGPPQRTTDAMATSNKAQAQCLQLCKNIAAAGDRVAERMAEYSTLVKHFPHGFDGLANELLDACQILFYIEAGLDEAVRSAHPLPLEMVTVMEKRFRAAQNDFKLLDQMMAKFLEYEQRGAMGRMRRGFAKAFGDNGIDKMTVALQKRREDLKMSALMFQWNLGTDKIESEPGIGYLGLAAALDDSSGSVRRSRNESIVSDDKASTHRSAPASQHRGLEGHRLGPGSPYSHPLPLLPPPKDGHKMSPFSPDSLSGESSSFAAHSSSEFGQASPSTRYTVSSTASSYDGALGRKHGPQDRLDTFEEVPEPSRELDALIADVVAMDLDGANVVNLKSEPFTMPRRRPRSNIDGDKINSRHALVSAARAKDHKLVLQLLDRGVSPNTGPDAHALNEAILGQDAESLRLLLLYGANPNETDREGVSPLVAAAQNNFFSAAAALLKYGADPNMSTGPDVESPLAIVAAANNVPFVHLLLMYGGNANQTSADGNTLLISSINKKTPKQLTEMLLGYGADPNDKNREGKTALFDAIQSARADLVTTLLENGANPNLPGPKHMLWPAAHHPECLQVLLNHGADHKKCPGVLELATSINSMEAITILLKAGVDPNAKKDGVYTPLCTSIRDNRSDIFQLLLSSRADPNLPASEYPAFKCVTHHREHFLPALVAAGSKLHSPKGILETAVTSKNANALRWLLDQGLDPNEKNAEGCTPLTSAIRLNRMDFIDTLLARKANPNVRGENWPVFMAVHNPEILERILKALSMPGAYKGVVEKAVEANQLESVKLLLKCKGLSVEDRHAGVFSPLTTALRDRRRSIITFLINEGGADVNAAGEHLPIVKALRRCADEQHQDIIDELLEKGADPNKVYRGWNGIMQALENGDAAMLKKLCEKSGVRLDVKDDLGRTVTEIAMSRGWEEAVDIMLKNAL